MSLANRFWYTHYTTVSITSSTLHVYIGAAHGNQSTWSRMLKDKPFSQSTVLVVPASVSAAQGTSSSRLVRGSYCFWWRLCVCLCVCVSPCACKTFDLIKLWWIWPWPLTSKVFLLFSLNLYLSVHPYTSMLLLYVLFYAIFVYSESFAVV